MWVMLPGGITKGLGKGVKVKCLAHRWCYLLFPIPPCPVFRSLKSLTPMVKSIAFQLFICLGLTCIRGV